VLLQPLDLRSAAVIAIGRSLPEQIDPVGFLGREFVAYVANSDPSEIEGALADSQHDQHAVVSQAVRKCVEVLIHHGSSYFEAFATVPPGRDESVANAMRLASGGHVPAPPEVGDLEQPLANLVRDVFPALLLEPAQEAWGFERGITPPHRNLWNAVNENVGAVEFQARLAGDPLASLFTTDPTPPFFSFSSGSGTTVEASSLAPAIVGTAAVRAGLTTANLTLGDVVEQVEQVIADLRRIQADGTCDVPVVVALRGIDVQPGVHFKLPWGWLRGMDRQAFRAVGDAVPQGGALLVTVVKSHVLVRRAPQPEPNAELLAPKRQVFTRDMESRVEKATLTLLLLDESPRLAVVPTTEVGITPFFGIGWGPEALRGSRSLPDRRED
jgi:hypothetical protein